MHRFAASFLVLLVLGMTGCGQDESRTAATPTTKQVPAQVPSEQPREATRGTTSATPAASKPSASASPAPATGRERMAPTPASVLRDTELKERPFLDAKTLKSLRARSAVTIVDREGGWLRVIAAGQQGWVRLLHVSSQPRGSASAAQELESAAKIATGRAGSDNIVSTTGIRGLNEEQLRKAEPNPAELQRMESYGVSREQAEAYARKHGLERRQVAQLPQPG